MRCRAETNNTKLWRGKANSWPSSMDAELTVLETWRRFLVARGIHVVRSGKNGKEKLNLQLTIDSVCSVLLVQRLVY